MMKINSKLKQPLTTLLFVSIMSMAISFAMVAVRLGFSSIFLHEWMKSWLLAFIVALPCAILTGKAVGWIISKIEWKN